MRRSGSCETGVVAGDDAWPRRGDVPKMLGWDVDELGDAPVGIRRDT